MSNQGVRMRILIAEDSTTQAELLKSILERRGYLVAVAENGVQALALLDEFKPDLVISDIVMPKMDGYELCRRIRALKNTSNLPVVLLTALADTRDVLEGLSCGADSFITKPYSRNYLLEQVAQMLSDCQRPEGADGAPVSVDIVWGGKKCVIVTDQKRTVTLLISTYEAAVRRNAELSRTQDELKELNERLEDLVSARTAELSSEIAVRSRTEEALRESELRLRDLTFSIADWVWEVDEHGVYTFSTQKGSDYFGKNIVGKTPFDFMPPDEAKRFAAIFSVIVANKAPIKDLENWNIRENGERICLLTNGVPILDKQGNLKGYRGVNKDITDRKRTEAERERLAMAIEQAGEIVMVTNAEGTIQYVNPVFEVMTGYSRAEVLGQSARILKSGEQDEAFYHEILATIGSGRIWQGRLAIRRKEGVLHLVDATISPVYDDAGRIVNYVSVERDVTEQLQLAEEKAGLEEQLRQSQKVEAIGQLAGGIAHDFNNMMAIVLGYGEMLLGRLQPDDPARNWAEQIVAAGRRSAALTRQLLAFSRKQTLQPEVLDLNALLRNFEKMLGRIGENILLELKLAGDLGRVIADPGQIEQVVMNLVVNARDAMPMGGRLTVETTDVELEETYALGYPSVVPGRYVLLALTDTGCGMDKATLGRLFEPFFTTKPKGKGTGLGLATVHGIVKQSGGHIRVSSEPGQGTTFKIYLPRTDAEPAANVVEASGETPRGSGERILLVEDEVSLRELCETVLSRLGYRVSAVGSGEEALALVAEKGLEPDLVVTDVVMTGMSGTEMGERLLRERPDLNVLYMSGYPDEAIACHGVLDPGTLFLQKPFTERALATKVREALSAKAAAVPPGRRVLMIDDDEQFRELVRHFCAKRGHVFAGADSAAGALAALAKQSFDVLLVDMNIPGTSGAQVLREIRAAGHAAPAIVLTGDVASADMELLRPLGAVRALQKSSDGEPLLQAIEAAGTPGGDRKPDG